MATTYYQDELSKVNTKSPYAPTIVINSGDGSGKTKHLNINDESAKELVKWLTANYNVKEANTECSIFIKWTYHDILDRAEQNRLKVTKDYACKILASLEARHDATIGINWDMIDDYLYGRLTLK